ncbi:MAG: polyprenol monophosphomannose synthase [Pseudomonadota bacterium]
MFNLSLILPTYNEHQNIGILIHRIFTVMGGAEVIVVDDDSPDGTWEVVQALCEKYPRLRVHRRIQERGLRSAIQAGIDMSEEPFVGWLDCDLSMPPELFVEMADRLRSADLVVGSRYVQGGRDRRPFWRRFSSRIINSLGRFLLGTKIRDLTSGFILCKREVLERFRLIGDYGEYFIALIFRAESAGLKIVEVPYVFEDRTHGKSKTGGHLLDFFHLGTGYVGMIMQLFLERIRE